MDPLNFSDAILGILAQRLTKRLCVQCKRPEVASDEEITALAEEYCPERPEPATTKRKSGQQVKDTVAEWRKRFANADGELVLYRAVGCEACENIGYNGRVALHELLSASAETRAAIRERASTTIL